MLIFWKYITDSILKMTCIGIFVKHTLCSLYWNQHKVCKPEQREDNSYNLLMGQSKFSYELMYGSIQLKTVANKQVKIPRE